MLQRDSVLFGYFSCIFGALAITDIMAVSKGELAPPPLAVTPTPREYEIGKEQVENVRIACAAIHCLN